MVLCFIFLYAYHGVLGTKVGPLEKNPSLSPVFAGSPTCRHPRAQLCQCHHRGNLCAGRRWLSSGFPCQAPKRASRWWKLRFDLLFLSFCQLNIWDGGSFCDILVLNKNYVHAVRKILCWNEIVCSVCLPLQRLLNDWVFFRKPAELDDNKGRQDKLNREESLRVYGYQRKRQKGRTARLWLLIFHLLALAVR